MTVLKGFEQKVDSPEDIHFYYLLKIVLKNYFGITR